jgi:HSP20 family protein
MKTSLLPWTKGRYLPVAREDEYPDIYSLRREMNSLFDTFFGGIGTMQPAFFGEELSRFTPKIDVKETDAQIVVSAELPGMTEKEVELILGEDQLVLRGEKKEEKEEKTKGHYRMERSYGEFYRAVPMPCEIQKDKVEAIFKDGVITITLPKVKVTPPEAKKITIKSS